MITPIKLTKDHRVKLIEMCENLFNPKEISHWLISPSDMIRAIDQRNDKAIEIHWLEFCLTHLFTNLEERWDELEKLYGIWVNSNNFNEKSKYNGLPSFELDRGLLDLYYHQDEHPIDQLYEEFAYMLEHETEYKKAK